MSGKLLFVIVSGPDDVNRVSWGLRMALNTYTHPYGERILENVRVLLFCSGVSIVEPTGSHSEELREKIRKLVEAGVEVASCVSIAEPLGLVGESEELGVKLVHASVYVARCVSEGYAIITF